MQASTFFVPPPPLQTRASISKSMELPLNKSLINISIIISFSLILITIISLNYPLLKQTSSSVFTYKTSSQTRHSFNGDADDQPEKCDIFSGEWVRDPSAPYYTNKTCWAIDDRQNCMKYGRPDSEFMKWRWKPDDCDLPLFDPSQFLDMVRDKSMAIVGDSVGRNQMQSMICLLSRVENPVDVSPTSDELFKRWKYQNYNFTLAFFTSPFLVRSEGRHSPGPTRTYLDEPDPAWALHIDEFDYLNVNAGHWFTGPVVFHRNRRIVGCHYCHLPNITALDITYGYRHAFRTAFEAINGRINYTGVTFLRTFAPSHFEGGPWNDGGNCLRRRPYRRNETILEGVNLNFYTTQLEEFRVAEKEGIRRKKKWRVLDLTRVMLLRPDGHPGRFGHWPGENVTLYNDCVHWCLPGPVDSWADSLQHMIKMEARKDYKERLLKIQIQKKTR